MTSGRGVLLDVYRTAVHTDFAAVFERLATEIDVAPRSLSAALNEVAPAVTVGRVTMADALATAVSACGRTVTHAEAIELARLDAEALIGASSVFDDVLPFIESCRRIGVPVAFVSNCAENTRPLLQALGLANAVDAIVLSCEVGSAKPSPEIFDHALAALNADAPSSVLIDDQVEYCDGAESLGITAVHIRRGAPADTSAVSSLGEVPRLLGWP